MKFFEVKDDGIYEVEETYSLNCFSGEYASRIMRLVIPRDVLVEALDKWGLIEDPCKECGGGSEDQ